MIDLECRGSCALPPVPRNCSQLLINPIKHRRDDCQKHCHYGCYDSCETFIDLEFDSALFEQFFFYAFLFPFPQMACPPSVGFNQSFVLFDYVYIILRNCVFVNGFTSIFRVFIRLFFTTANTWTKLFLCVLNHSFVVSLYRYGLKTA